MGIATQDELEARLDPVAAGNRVRNYLASLTMECQTLARACGKSHVHNLEPEDLAALTIEAAAMARVPLAGVLAGSRAVARPTKAERRQLCLLAFQTVGIGANFGNVRLNGPCEFMTIRG